MSLEHACAASWAASPLPFWLSGDRPCGSKVRLRGRLDATYVEHQRLVVESDPGDLVWVMYDEKTRFVSCSPDTLQVGQRLEVDGVLSSGRLQATRLRTRS
jgi:hypothetical protein